MKRLILMITAALMLSMLSAAADGFDETGVIVSVDTSKAGISFYSDTNDIFDGLDISDSECVYGTRTDGIALFNAGADTCIMRLTLKEGGEENVRRTIDALNALPQVKYAEPDYIVDTFYEPDDEYYQSGAQTALTIIDAESVWDMDIDCSGVTVGVADTGIRLDHPDLKENIWINTDEIPADGIDNDENGYIDDVYGWDFGDNDNNPIYSAILKAFHGVHVSGIISAVTNNGIGVASLGRNVKTAPLKIMDSSGYNKMSSILKAFDYAKKNGIKILNNSWGSREEMRSVKEVIAGNPDTLYVFAAGNITKNDKEADNDALPIYPASYTTECENVISVANTTNSDVLHSSSHYGKKSVDIAAPGTGIKSTYAGTADYGMLTGTSMACPMIASAAAVMKAANPNITPSEIKEILMASSDKIDALADKTVSGGRLNAAAAVRGAIALLPTPIPPTFAPPEERVETQAAEGTVQITVLPDDEAEEETMIIAEYDVDGTLLCVTPCKAESTVYNIDNEKTCSVKVFIWNSVSGMRPVSIASSAYICGE